MYKIFSLKFSKLLTAFVLWQSCIKHCFVVETRGGNNKKKKYHGGWPGCAQSQEHLWTQPIWWRVSLPCCLGSSCWGVLKHNQRRSRLKSPWWQTSCGRRAGKHRARRWRPISHWARTWWQALAPGPRSQHQSRRNKRTPNRKPDRWGCACKSMRMWNKASERKKMRYLGLHYRQREW